MMSHLSIRCPHACWASTLAALLLAGTSRLGAQRAQRGDADIVLLGGKVFTAASVRPWAEAVAVRGGRILAVGTTSEIALLAGPRTRRIALGGRTVVPGFDDAHAHVGPSATPGVRVTVEPSPTPDPSLAAVLDSLAAAVPRTPAGTWLTSSVGGRVLDDPRATRATLDSIAPLHPVWLGGWSGHGAVLNTAALRAAGLLSVADPAGGWLARDARGVPTGRIDEYAIYGAHRRLAVARGDSILGLAVRAYGESGLRLGITSVQDMAVQYDLDAARGAARRGGAMRARHRIIRFPIGDTAGSLTTDWRMTGADTVLASTTHVSGVKWIVDGTPIERLALMRRPYADRPGWYGRANFPFDTLRAMLRDALARGDQPMLHAVGDSAIALVIAAMRAEAPDSVWRRLRPRLEHADGLGRDQLADLKALGIVVVQNPAHLAIPAVLTTRWGAERLRTVDLLRTLVDSGVPLAVGSDGPREPGINIMLATLHPNVPGEALTREQAVTAYTRGSAYAAFAERERGTLAPGMLADLAVLSQDVFTVAPDALPATTSILTMLGGQVVHEAGVGPGRGSRPAGHAVRPPSRDHAASAKSLIP
jgi:predicted amidohydrolase YtcJ